MALACSCSTLPAAAPGPETAPSSSSCLHSLSSSVPSRARAKSKTRCFTPPIASALCGIESGRAGGDEGDGSAVFSRRSVCRFAAVGAAAMAAAAAQGVEIARAGEYTDMPALRGKDYGKTITKYPDYTQTESGLQYKDLREGSGAVPQRGETVVVDWDGYTIGYYGRIFEARNKAKGGSFEGNEKDFFRFKLGQAEVIPAFEEAVASMRVGGVRRILVPPTLGYPDNDFGKSGPRPTTFSGQRALDFVLKNQGLIDKTLLFDIELLKVVPAS